MEKKEEQKEEEWDKRVLQGWRKLQWSRKQKKDQAEAWWDAWWINRGQREIEEFKENWEKLNGDEDGEICNTWRVDKRSTVVSTREKKRFNV